MSDVQSFDRFVDHWLIVRLIWSRSIDWLMIVRLIDLLIGWDCVLITEMNSLFHLIKFFSLGNGGKPKLVATISSPVRPSTAPHQPLSRTRSMVPAGGGDSPATGYSHYRTASPLLTSYTANDRFLAIPPATTSHHAPSINPYHHQPPMDAADAAAVEQVRGTLDRLFAGDDASHHFRSVQPSQPQQERYFSPPEITARDPSNDNQSLDMLLNSRQFFPPQPQQQTTSYNLLNNSKKSQDNSSTHRALSQTLSDPFAAPRLGGHGKLQRQLSLNPYASHSYSEMSQFFAPSPVHSPQEDTFFSPAPSGLTGNDRFGGYLNDAGSFFAPQPPPQRQVPVQQPSSGGGCSNQNSSHGARASSNLRMILQDATRVHLFDRLSCLFAEEKVLYVMQCYPQETNCEKLCGYILKIFPADE